MISTVKHHAHPKNIGVYAIQARLNLAEVVVITSILYNVEAYHVYEDHEIANLEHVQHKILIGILELPTTTPYYSLLINGTPVILRRAQWQHVKLAPTTL